MCYCFQHAFEYPLEILHMVFIEQYRNYFNDFPTALFLWFWWDKKMQGNIVAGCYHHTHELTKMTETAENILNPESYRNVITAAINPVFIIRNLQSLQFEFRLNCIQETIQSAQRILPGIRVGWFSSIANGVSCMDSSKHSETYHFPKCKCSANGQFVCRMTGASGAG